RFCSMTGSSLRRKEPQFAAIWNGRCSTLSGPPQDEEAEVHSLLRYFFTAILAYTNVAGTILNVNDRVNPRGCTNHKLRQLSRMLTRHYDAYVSATGLKNSQYSSLSHVVLFGPIRPT